MSVLAVVAGFHAVVRMVYLIRNENHMFISLCDKKPILQELRGSAEPAAKALDKEYLLVHVLHFPTCLEFLYRYL